MTAKTLLRPRFVFLAALLAALLASAVWAVSLARATPPSGLTATPLGAGNLPQPVQINLNGGMGPGIAVAQLMTTKYVLEPGGTFGWHQHGGPVWVVVAAGTVTLYDGDDPACQAHAHTAPVALLDEGTHTHVARNEGDVNVEIYATFMLPEGGQARVDAAAPSQCPF